MAKPNQANEVFRFICARPAIKDVRSIKVRRRSDEATRRLSDEPSSSQIRLRSSSFAVSSRSLKYVKKIAALDELLDLDNNKLEIGRYLELENGLVRASVSSAFAEDNLAEIIETGEWKKDEELLDKGLVQLYDDSADPLGRGPLITRYRQLYDLVRQVANKLTREEGEDPFVLKGLELDLQNETLSSNTRRQQSNTSPERKVVRPLRPLSEEEKKTKIRNLVEGLRALNSSAVHQYRTVNKQNPFQFLLKATWVDLLAEDPKKAVVAAGIKQGNTTLSLSITHYYDVIMNAIRATSQAGSHAPIFKSGLFTIGPFNLEMTKPWTLTAGIPEATPDPDKFTPVGTKSQIKPTGVGDLVVVRDHVYSYIGGEIGAIQNVLKSEGLTRETKRLDRTELVEFESQAVEKEEEREQSTTTRFNLNKEANDIIKKDSSLKAGVSTTAYGPYVSVKGDLSFAENNSSESSNKIASQYSQDITSRATSKIIEKTFRSTSRTTISQFEELNKHEFKNTDPSSNNISGVYQWVNKVSQCQMYNYGKRLLIDITIPEPAAFLMTQSGDAGPTLENPPPLTESAADLHEGNYSAIAARYQATGIKPPGDLLVSFSRSFKADVTPGSDPKPGQANARLFGSSANVNLDVEIPAGYLAYAAKIQVGVRTGPSIGVWAINGTGDKHEWFADLGLPRVPNTYVSVAGQIIKPNAVKPTDTEPKGTDTSEPDKEGVKQNSAGTIFFTEPLLSRHIAVSVSQDFCLALSGTIQVCCVREPVAYAQWQQATYDSILTAYTKAKMDYERSRSEAAISTLSVTTGNNPLENTDIIKTELKKAAISFITAQNFHLFGSVVADPEDGIPQVQEFEKAIAQGKYAEFFEKAFEWENITYSLYPYFWAKRTTWRQRVGFHSPDPAFSDFVKAGAAKVTVPARLGFGLEVIHMLQTGGIWYEGPVSTLATTPYYSAAQEIMAAEANPEETKISEPWYTVIPTELVQLRPDSVLPRFKQDDKGVWVERDPSESDDE